MLAAVVLAFVVGAGFGARVTGPLRVEVTFAAGDVKAVREVLLFRSTTALEIESDTIGLPVAVFRPGPVATFTDTTVAQSVRYYYRAAIVNAAGQTRWTAPESVDIRDTVPARVQSPNLCIDKLHYFLAVRDGGRTLKRYPIALGRQPRRRKLHQDNASTPEGKYHILSVQPHARFYKAFNLDYPNATDVARYRRARDRHELPRTGGRVPDIGGEIQIHGLGIETNWTYGCIALRNSDMDELFGLGTIGPGTPVYISGSGVGPEGAGSP
jgi:hypothetical protein